MTEHDLAPLRRRVRARLLMVLAAGTLGSAAASYVVVAARGYLRLPLGLFGLWCLGLAVGWGARAALLLAYAFGIFSHVPVLADKAYVILRYEACWARGWPVGETGAADKARAYLSVI